MTTGLKTLTSTEKREEMTLKGPKKKKENDRAGDTNKS